MRTENEMEKIAQEYSDLLVRRDTSWTLERGKSREKAEIQLYASVEDVHAESAERVPHVEFPQGTEGMEGGE